MADLPQYLKKDIKTEEDVSVESVNTFHPAKLEGEVDLINRSEESKILKKVEQLKELEIERKEGQTTGTSDNNNTATDDSSDGNDDSDLNVTGALKYYGYEVSRKSLQAVSGKIKGKLDSSDTWLGVWLTRLLKMN